ncbi:substrate-binding periplasmic protein [Roseateles saccharophilus]|uniref:ABC-type amino acid transport substrate-binding protein n=1 Tax=Roseateles saccharophilus TaxID=304 RepID=A0A4R3UR81_ROSSA|nr:transporter substrate-binding domain-containing protein [Roseateles saccharophilus]MDG0833246.1 transporter substrate-binding domain-containing protein [Roseateles saccharophilus]TCU94405.1 ABC-type amino acid transport substrate-binding protein [Roseateles saccharophilus]
MPPRRRELLISAAGLPLAAAHGAARRLRVPQDPAGIGLERSHPAQLLRLALAAAGMPVELEPSPESLTQKRAIFELARSGGTLDVLWTMTSVEREQQARPVRIPIYRGLNGWRLLLASAETAARMREVRTLAELRRFSLVQRLEWPDTNILQANGLDVIESASFDAMFKQLRLGRADAFPRSVKEIWRELEHQGRGLTVVPDICLHYPAATYYFVAPGNTELAAAIEVGLQRLRVSGELERLLLKHHGEDLARARLGSRRVIELSNPLLPPQTPLDKPELWYRT